MLWVKLTTLEAQDVLDALSSEEDADEAFEILSAAIANPVEEEIPDDDDKEEHFKRPHPAFEGN